MRWHPLPHVPGCLKVAPPPKINVTNHIVDRISAKLLNVCANLQTDEGKCEGLRDPAGPPLT